MFGYQIEVFKRIVRIFQDSIEENLNYADVDNQMVNVEKML